MRAPLAAWPDRTANSVMKNCSGLSFSLQILHRRVMPPRPLSTAQVEALRLIAKGYRYADAAGALQISQSALKARITAARQQLHARTTAEAIQRAASCNLI